MLEQGETRAPDAGRRLPRSVEGPAINDTHRRLLDAAVRLFAARGFHGTGIRELATEAKLSTASLYHYMGTKELLLFQIMHDALERLLLAARIIEQQSPDPGVRIASLVRMHVITHALQRDASNVVDNEIDALEPAQRAVIVQQRDTYEAYWADAIAQGVEAGYFSVLEQRFTRLALLEICSGVARWFSPGGEQTLDQIAESHVDLATGLLRIPRERPEWASVVPTLNIHDLVEEIWAIRVRG